MLDNTCLFYSMFKRILTVLLLLYGMEGSAQKMIVLKKKQTSIQHFWEGGHIPFRLKDKQWLTGLITRITPDSFYFTKEIIRYSPLGTDTLRMSGFRFALQDIEAMPTKKQLVVYRNDQVTVILGHEKFVWIRNGFIFQAVGAGYAGLNIANDLIRNEPPFAGKKRTGLAISGAAFLFGTLLHLRFDPYLHMGRKYHLESI